MGSLGYLREGQGSFPAVAAKSPLHTQPMQLAEHSVELVWPRKVVPAPSWGRERQWHWGRADLRRAARWEPTAVWVQQGRAPAPALRQLRVSILPLPSGGEG